MGDFVNLVNHGGKHSTSKPDWERTCKAFKEGLTKQVERTGNRSISGKLVGLPAICPTLEPEERCGEGGPFIWYAPNGDPRCKIKVDCTEWNDIQYHNNTPVCVINNVH